MIKLPPPVSSIVVLACVAYGALFTACGEESFHKDPLCSSCIRAACSASDPESLKRLVAHFEAADDELAAQLVSRADAIEGCSALLDSERVSALYAKYPRSFYAPSQPFSKDRAKRALQTVASSGEHDRAPHEKAAAADYLVSKADPIRQDAPLLELVRNTLSPLAEHNDEVFELLAVLLTDLSVLEALPETDARNHALVSRYPELSPETRARVLKPFVSARWQMQSSGSTLQPQRLELDWQMLPLPPNSPPLAASIHVRSVSVKNEEAKKRGVFVRDWFDDAPMLRPDRHRIRVDLGPWLKTADTYRVAATAELSLWRASASEACLKALDGCDEMPLAVYPVVKDFTYRAYVGVETGAPKRYKNADDNAPTSKKMRLSICNASGCTMLWDGKATPQKSRMKLDVVQGHDFYLLADLNEARLPVAGRLMARSMPGAPWQEVATFFSNAPALYAPDARANIDVSQVCRDMGKCDLELQLRPSLRMARRDPSVTRYWGDTLELGSLPIEIKNRTSSQVYKSF